MSGLKAVSILWFINAFILTIGWWSWAYFTTHGHKWVNNPLVALIVTHTVLKVVLTMIGVILFCRRENISL